jgi:alkaline phosphatase D
MSQPLRLDRRRLLTHAAAGLGGILLARSAPAQIRRDGVRPVSPSGVQSGDVTSDSGVVWGRTDRPSRMWVEWSASERFSHVRRIAGPNALPDTDHTARVVLEDLPAGEPVFYRVQWEDLAEHGLQSEPISGSFRTAPRRRREVHFAWSGDVCGQGWGIDAARGGMRGWETVRAVQPDFFIHSGDTIYADNPLVSEIRLDDGSLWKNEVTPEKAKVAETLAEFRGCQSYNRRDENLRRFSAEVPIIAQWDDHETMNNWYPQKILADARYRERRLSVLSARARRAFLEYHPLRPSPEDPERIYRSFPYGPTLEVFMLDERSYRGPNGPNRQEQPGRDTDFMGSAQVRWLKRKLERSRATWKVIASDMPIGLVVGDGPGAFEAFANGNGPALGRELELAGLLRFIRDRKIRNVVWLTADVHYAAAHYYNPHRARFQEFLPFWEFVAGPLHAGTFGPGTLDDTFGPEVKFSGIPAGLKGNRPPSDPYQFFGTVRIDGKTEVMQVALHNTQGRKLYEVDLNPDA